MLKNPILRLSALALCALLTGCTVGSPGSNSGSFQQPLTLTVWVDAELAPAAAVVAEQFNANTGHKLSLVEKDFGGIEAELASSPNPDLFIGSSEWTDRLAAAGVIANLEDVVMPGFIESVTRATSFQGKRFAVPYAVESLALVCNGNLVPNQPKSPEDLAAVNFKLILSPGGDPYTLFPLQSSFGVLPLELDDSGDWQEATGLNAERGPEFASWLAQNRSLIRELDYSSAINSLVDEVEPCLLTGPWARPELEQRAKFELKVYDFPSFGGEQPYSFASSRALFVSSQSENLEVAKTVAEYFASEESQRLIHTQTGRVPTLESLLSSLSDPLTKGFARAAKLSLVLPSSSAMQNTWVPWSTALNSLIGSEEQPAVIWDRMITELSSKVG